MSGQTETPTVADAVEVPVSAGVAPVGVVPGTVPDVGLRMSSDHRYWFNGEGPNPSVTTVLGILDKQAVTTWRVKQAIQAVLRMAPEFVHAARQNPQAADELIWQAMQRADDTRDKAATLGSSVHLLADMASRGSESDSKGFQVFEQEKPYLEAFRGFLDRYSASSIVSSEKAVWSLNGYAGTYDLLMLIHKQLWLVDIKTSKGVYPETGLQLAAYRWADYIILPNDPKGYPMPEVHRTGVLHLRPDQYKEGWRLYEYPTTYTDDFIPFLGLLEGLKWKQSKRFMKGTLPVIGKESL